MTKITKSFTIQNPQGLHARPAALFVQTASKYNSHVTVYKDGEQVNGKSIIGILTLGAQHNSEITLEVDGDDAEQVMNELSELLNRDDLK
jgi:phosphocarrier protein HPr